MTYNQTQKVIENRNSFSNDPGNDPNDKDDQDPHANGVKCSLAHTTSTAEQAHVDLLGGDVGVDNTSNDNLHVLATMPSMPP